MEQLQTGPPAPQEATARTLLAVFVLDRIINTLKLLIYPVRGLFFYSPLLLVAGIGLYRAVLQRTFSGGRRLVILSGTIFTAYLAFNALLNGWWAGVSYGPRYLIIAIPFLAIPFASALTKPVFFKAAAALLPLSMFQNLVGSRGAIIMEGSSFSQQLGVEPGHLLPLLEGGTVSLNHVLIRLHPHSWENYVEHASRFVIEGPPLNAVTTLFSDQVWTVGLPSTDVFIHLWIGGSTILFSRGWLTFGALLLLLAAVYRRPLWTLWRMHRSARIAIIIGAIALILLPVH